MFFQKEVRLISIQYLIIENRMEIECQTDNKHLSIQNNANSRGKQKFCVKILQLLRITLNDEKKIPEIGLAWCDDGFHFICNSQILGKYLNLKANSINTNFRAHSFQIGNATADDIKKTFGNLPDYRNWKMRHNINYAFNSSSSDNDAENIPCTEKQKNGLEIVTTLNSIFPPITVRLLKNEANPLHQIEVLIAPVKFSQVWKHSFLSQATSDWMRFAGTSSAVNSSNIINSIINFADPRLDENSAIIVEKNLSYFLKYSNCSSQSVSNVNFIDYLKLSLRFGFLNRIAHTILELSNFDSNSSSSSNTSVSFAPWFVPSAEQVFANDILNRTSLDWVIKLAGSAPNMYSILRKSEHNVISSHITFNPMPMKPDLRLSIEAAGGNNLSEESWEPFLSNVLGLKIPTTQTPVINHQSVEHVPMDQFLKTNPEQSANTYVQADPIQNSSTENTASNHSNIDDDIFISPVPPEFSLSQMYTSGLSEGQWSQTVHTGMTPDLFGSQSIHSGLSPDL
ncbi:hypothetical protein TRFO_23507 [Tritrichomonas foetus]|uniref:Initiator binding domain-containing protein n=1 Tax=Tritrichomonas foetus TaxID=1144522 RepID=A0A1J4KEW6_9EUKA|nr:hypothetical protein TRFO_23507 [Tritrichomonas foetus]|eukprot:OHT08134.1 hypothetical protein TRFO_23507 [Tritrichomonas foetus]